MGLRPVTRQTDRERAQSLHDLAVALGATCPCQRRDNVLKLASTTLKRFNPNHYGPGERGGQFAPKDEGDAGSSSDDTGSPKPVEVADSGQVATDAQIAQEEDKERDDEESDPIGPARAALYISARGKLYALDPSNAALKPIVTNPGWTPSRDDVNNMEDALNRAIEDRAAEAAEHSYKEHVEIRKEFPEIHSQTELQLLAQDVMSRYPPRTARNGQTLFYQSSTNTLVIVDPDGVNPPTIYRPTRGQAYVDDQFNDN